MTSSPHKLKKDKGEAPCPSSDLLTLFLAFARALPQLIADERDMAGYTGQDPAVDPWVRAAEASRQTALTACHAVLDAKASHAFDVALQKAAEIFKTIEESRDPAKVYRNRENAKRRRWAWLVPADARWGNEYNQLIHFALDAVETRLKLEDIFDDRALEWADEGPDL